MWLVATDLDGGPKDIIDENGGCNNSVCGLDLFVVKLIQVCSVVIYGMVVLVVDGGEMRF